MKLKSIAITGYRSFGNKNNVLEINAGVTTIVGMNGSGKSNLVDIIGYIDLVNGTNERIKPQYHNRILDIPISISVDLQPTEDDDMAVTGIEISRIVISEDNGYSLSGSIADILSMNIDCFDLHSVLNNAMSQGKEKTEALSRVNELRKFRSIPLIRLKQLANSIKSLIDYNVEDTHEKDTAITYIDNLSGIIDRIICSIPVFFYHDDSRQLKNTYSIDEINHVYNNGNNRNVSIDYKPDDLIHSLIKLAAISQDDIIRAINDRTSSVRTTFEKQSNRKLEQNIMQGFRSFYKKGMENLTMEFRIDGTALHIMINSGDTSTSFSERSNGLRWYLKMYIDMMQRADTERPIVYIMDEPGIYLHINAQDELRQLLIEKSVESQIIYTTHSPYMIDKSFGCLRSITKTEHEGFSFIQNSLFSSVYSQQNATDTLSPIAAALGMDIGLTPGLSPQKLNVIVEGITDQIYLQTMMKRLEIDESRFHIIPSTGADNIRHLCSIFLGWGFRFVALFDYDDKGKKCCKELEKELRLDYMSGFMMLKDISPEEYKTLQKIKTDDAIVIEDLLSKEDQSKYGIQVHEVESQKRDNAVRFSDAVSKGQEISKTTIANFRALLNRIDSFCD